jgi:hypothetical protein
MMKQNSFTAALFDQGPNERETTILLESGAKQGLIEPGRRRLLDLDPDYLFSPTVNANP